MARRRFLPRRLRRAIKRGRNELIFLGFRGVLGALRLLPIRVGMALGRVAGNLAYYLLWPERAKALRHLEIAFGGEKTPSERRRIARRSFVHLALNFVELANFRKMWDRLDTYVELQDRAGIDRCLEGGKGLIWVTGHLGNWEILASYFARYQHYKVNAISRHAYDRRMQEILVGIRAENGVRTVERGDARSIRDLIRAFRQNEVLAMLIDQDTKVQSVFVDFFGKPANTPVAAASLAYRMDAPVIVGFIERLPDGRHRIIYSGPVELPQTGDPEADQRLATAEFTRRIEAQIRRVPEQWVWMHRRWRRRPPDEAQSAAPGPRAVGATR
ncbi:MAG: lysophospholipid acyltransferase family protein [Deltaproteobacteria bacterium]|nr:lysophospholipid acyltransferase family protein [Deltaproteobacteria bacterium]